MKKMFKFLLLIFIAINCDTKKDGFIINGTIEGIEDGELIYLMDENSRAVDSTYLLKKQFVFNGIIAEPKKVFVFIERTMDFKSFWLENNTIVFSAKSKEFISAKISGSDTQKLQTILDARLSKGGNEYSSIVRDFIKEYPNTIVSLKSLNDMKTKFGREVTSDLFSNMTQKNQGSELGEFISMYLSLNREIQIGNPFSDFTLTNLKDESIKFSTCLGSKVTLLDFWASWCGPCRMENPNLVRYYEKYKKEGLQVVSVSLDTDRTDWVNAIKKDGMKWTQLSDLKGYQNQAALIYNVGGLPSSYLFDEHGNVLAMGLSANILRDKLEELFGY